MKEKRNHGDDLLSIRNYARVFLALILIGAISGLVCLAQMAEKIGNRWHNWRNYG